MSERVPFTPRILKRTQVFGEDGITGMSSSSGYEQIALGNFPKPVPLTDDENSRLVGWLDFEVYAWIESRRALRDKRLGVEPTPLTVAPAGGAVLMTKREPA